MFCHSSSIINAQLRVIEPGLTTTSLKTNPAYDNNKMGLTSMAMCTCRPRAGAWQWSESPQACNCQLVVASCRHTCTSSVILFKKRTLQKKEPYSRQRLSMPSAGMPVASYECQSFTIRVTRASTSRIIWRKLIARIPHRATATATTRQLVVYSFS